jgi:nitrile hydratase
MDGVHDLGGMHGFGAVVVPGGEAVFHDPWEPRVFALYLLTGIEGLGGGPGGRATRERMRPPTPSAGCGAPSSAYCARGRSRPARSSA